MKTNRFYIALCGLLVSAGLASAKSTWTMTTTDFAQKQITIETLGPETTVLIGKDKSDLRLDEILELRRAEPAKPKGLILRLANGDELYGAPVHLSADAITFSATNLGEIEIPLNRVAGLYRDSSAVDFSQKRTEDSVKLTNGDAVSGILSDMDAKNVTIQKSNGENAPLALESVQSILFAQTPAAPADSGQSAVFRVTLASGSRVTATDLSAKAQSFSFKPLGGKVVTLDDDGIASIERLNGPVVWLSTRTPTENVHTPYFDGQFPARMDRSIQGDPIRFGQQSFARGIGVHSKSRLTFAIESGDTTFRTRYALDGQLAYADVDVRILVDDQVVHEAKGFKCGKLADAVEIPLVGHKTLTLEVDYGQGYDVQDRFNWIEPAILRK